MRRAKGREYSEFVGFLTDIVASQPAGKALHVIANNLSSHKTKLVASS